MAKSKDDSWWKQAMKRSVFSLTPTMQLVVALQKKGWAPGENIASMAKQRLSGILQSKIAEDIIGCGKKLEKAAPNPTQIPPSKIFKQLIDSKIIDGLYRFQEPRWRDQP
eukprot:3605206-Heterocapsa_arctica.AAC.1